MIIVCMSGKALTISMRSSIGHGEYTLAFVQKLEILIIELLPIN